VGSIAPLFLLGLIYFFKFFKSRKGSHFLGAVFLISLTAYTYRTMSLLAPLSLIILGLIGFKQLRSLSFKWLLAGGLVAGVLIGAFLYFTTIGAPDTPRIAQLAISSDPAVPIWIQRDREVDSGDYQSPTIGKKAKFSSYFFHNKPLSWGTNFAKNYLTAFSTDFLFLNGDQNIRHSIGKRGQLYAIDLVTFFVGLVFVLRRIKQPAFAWLTAWLFFSPIAAAITLDGGTHAARLFIFSTPLLIVVGIGWWEILRLLPRLARPVAWITWGLFVIFYLHRYHVHFPIESANNFGYGFKQATQVLTSLTPQFREVILTSAKDPPMIYYLFWSHTSPRMLQAYGTDFSKKPGFADKFTVLDWNKDLPLHEGALYLVSTNEFPADFRVASKVPADIKLHQIIKYPDNEVAFYIVSLK
jgi:hypothetical protein